MADQITEELEHVKQHEVTERRRNNLYLIAFGVVMLVVAIGLILAFSSIGSTVR